ncbi:LacI family transcriptional regulator [Brachybacterium phenoliresistens]|uniref:LacI family transcriptional regulator n=1 Tax=Brachybacterium phenoliresistens TaxID=396014 RepID=Z9JT21_9MICO|nr:LacI family DNA-binding transcriptional regulator [Brachybacterium phenoliresistens]EWS81349.1 LacI family transcriptional regulator [Brachybacterium phenoliresistens]
MVRMRDIAAELGISVSTVSLAVNHKDQGRVNPPLAERIRETADRMGYRPNLHALGLKLNKSHAIALICRTTPDDPFLSAMTGGAQAAATEAGYILITIPVSAAPGAEDEAIETALQRDVDGIIFAADYYRRRSIPEVPDTTPFVFLDCISTGSNPVVTEVIADEVQGSYEATAHLLRAGHTHVGYIGVKDDRYLARHLRERGFREAVREHLGAGASPLIVDAADPSITAGEAAARELLARDAARRPTALFCFSDRTAFGVAQAARAHGLGLPEDLSIVGFDNVEYTSEFFSPRLSTVELPHQQMSAEAVHQLVHRIENPREGPQRIKVPCPLILRDSVVPQI